MTPLLLALALVALTQGDSVAAAEPQLRLRPVQTIQETRLDLLGPVVSTVGDAVASASFKLQRSTLLALPANAEYMSLGPPGPWIPDTVSGPGLHFENPVFHRLRVTHGSCERSWWMVIDDIVTGRADSRTVNASYMFNGAPGLWSALRRAPRIVGSGPAGPPIAWHSPTSFSWIMAADTLVFEQTADSVFQLTLRARVR